MAKFTVNPGDMRTRITFQKSSITKKTSGATVPEWSNVATNATVWAQWINDHGQDAVLSDAKGSVQMATVRVRHRGDIVESWRVMKSGKPWEIISIDPVQDRNHWIELRVKRAKATA